MIMVGALAPSESTRSQVNLQFPNHLASGDLNTDRPSQIRPVLTDYEAAVDSLKSNLPMNVFFSPPENGARFGNSQRVGSNYGFGVDVWAPGSDILTAGPFANVSGSQTNIWSFSATSAAAPIVAGGIALMKALDPDLDYKEARRIIKGQGSNAFLTESFNPEGSKFILRSLPFPDQNRPIYDDDRQVIESNRTQCGEAVLRDRITRKNREYFVNCGEEIESINSGTMVSFHALNSVRELLRGREEGVKTEVFYGKTNGLTGSNRFLLLPNGDEHELKLARTEERIRGENTSRVLNVQHLLFGLTPRISSNVTSNAGLPLFHSPCARGNNSTVCSSFNTEYGRETNRTAIDIYSGAHLNALSPHYLRVEGWNDHGDIRVLSLDIVDGKDVPESERFGADPSSNPSSFPSDDPSDDPTPFPTPVPTPLPTPVPAPSLPPVRSFSAPVVTSQLSQASNIARPNLPNLSSKLKSGPFGSYLQKNLDRYLQAGPAPFAAWLKIFNPNQPILINYPRVPNTNNLGHSGEKFKLRILIQVKNGGRGGKVVVRVGGSTKRESFGPGSSNPNAEIRPILFDFYDGASESGGNRVEFLLEGADANTQVIYKLFGVKQGNVYYENQK